jgi:hypothetical protein
MPLTVIRGGLAGSGASTHVRAVRDGESGLSGCPAGTPITRPRRAAGNLAVCPVRFLDISLEGRHHVNRRTSRFSL